MLRDTDAIMIWYAIAFLTVGMVIGALTQEILRLQDELDRKPKFVLVSPKERELEA